MSNILEQTFNTLKYTIVTNIIVSSIQLVINRRFETPQEIASIYDDFDYIYQMSFKKYFLEYFTIESEHFLENLSVNFSHSVATYIELGNCNIQKFIEHFVERQFELVEYYDLFDTEN